MLRRKAISLGVLLVLTSACYAANSPRQLFEEAVRLDLRAETARAFETYLKAAEQGEPEAQFNVAVMLDSGRGTRSNIKQAAVWYARAAAHGNRRAAYNLALLYSNGEGVPKNEGIAQAWFVASGLSASTDHRERVQASATSITTKLQPPSPVAPENGSEIDIGSSGIELIWTADAQPGPVLYVVELRSLDRAQPYGAFLTPVATSSLAIDVPSRAGNYEWRIFAFSSKTMQYLPSAWTSLKLSRRSDTVR